MQYQTKSFRKFTDQILIRNLRNLLHNLKKKPAYKFIYTMSWRRTSIESKVDLNAC